MQQGGGTSWAGGYAEITSKHTEYEYFYVEFVLCIAGTTHQPRMDRSSRFRKTKTATADFVAWASKTQVHGRATEGADTACGPAPEKSGEIRSPWSSSEATDARLSDWLAVVFCGVFPWRAAPFAGSRFACMRSVCASMCDPQGQSEPDLLAACAVHLVDVAHHRIPGETWEPSRGGGRGAFRKEHGTTRRNTAVPPHWIWSVNNEKCNSSTVYFFPDLWRRRLKTDLPPPLPLSSSLPRCSAGRPPGLRGVMQGRMENAKET